MTVFKTCAAATIDVVNKGRALLPRIAQTLLLELKIQPLTDQSIFVKGAVFDLGLGILTWSSIRKTPR